MAFGMSCAQCWDYPCTCGHFDYGFKPVGPSHGDQNVMDVVAKFHERADAGKEKYGTNTMRTDIDLEGWLTHLQEELMDATVYIERVKKELENDGRKGPER